MGKRKELFRTFAFAPKSPKGRSAAAGLSDPGSAVSKSPLGDLGAKSKCIRIIRHKSYAQEAPLFPKDAIQKIRLKKAVKQPMTIRPHFNTGRKFHFVRKNKAATTALANKAR